MDRGNERKIGYSVNPKARLSEVSDYWNTQVTLCKVFQFDGCIQELERQVHGKLAFCWVEGEWFSCSVEEASDIILQMGGFPCDLPQLESRQQKWQQERQADGWKRLSVFLPPEYIAKAKAAAKEHGGLAEAVRHWLDQDARSRDN